MTTAGRMAASLIAGALFAAATATCAGELRAEGVPDGRWRVTRGIVAPWAQAQQPAPDARALIGTTLSFSADRFEAPNGLACRSPEFETGARPASGLFQGNLPAPASASAASLGLTADSTASVTLTCGSGVFDLHWVTPQALLLALDNVIWVLDRSPGALAHVDSPEGVVQALLVTHFADDMGFTRVSISRKRDRLSTDLRKKIVAYFTAPLPDDEAPPINGDPFTDSQEYPVLFSVGDAVMQGELARVPVRYDDGYRTREVVFVLRRELASWRVDDISYGVGPNLRALLGTPPAPP